MISCRVFFFNFDVNVAASVQGGVRSASGRRKEVEQSCFVCFVLLLVDHSPFLRWQIDSRDGVFARGVEMSSAVNAKSFYEKGNIRICLFECRRITFDNSLNIF